jgi:GTP cyclohydrolase IB
MESSMAKRRVNSSKRESAVQPQARSTRSPLHRERNGAARSADADASQTRPASRASAKSSAGAMPDVQASADRRNVAIDRVGVKDVTYPLRLRERDGGEQATVANINMYVALPHHQKGTHMSRFLEVLNEQTNGPVSPDKFMAIAREICEKLNAEEAHFEASFTYFIRKPAPVTGMVGLMDYRVTFECVANHHEDFLMTVSAPATSLCPCSKEISRYGAHNQRCRIEAKVRFKGSMWIEDLVELLENAASSPVYAVLKRPDEKFVTEQAFDNPKFVEDIVRDLAVALNDEDRITWYTINSENFESIHNHNAYAQIIRDKRDH